MENKITPLSEEIINDCDLSEPVFFADDVKKSINDCLKELIDDYNNETCDFDDIDFSIVFKRHFGELVE